MPRQGRYGPVFSHWYMLVPSFETSAQDFYTAIETEIGCRKVPNIDVSRIIFREAGFFSADREYLRIQRRLMAFDICAAPFGTGYFFSWWLTKQPPAFGFLKLCFLVLTPLTGAYFIEDYFGHGAAMYTLYRYLPGILYPPFVLALLTFLALFYLMGKSVQYGIFLDEDQVLELPIIGAIYERFFAPQTYYTHDTVLMFQEAVRQVVNDQIRRVHRQQGSRALADDDLRPRLRALGEQ